MSQVAVGEHITSHIIVVKQFEELFNKKNSLLFLILGLQILSNFKRILCKYILNKKIY
jgi:hypothetical protein